MERNDSLFSSMLSRVAIIVATGTLVVAGCTARHNAYTTASTNHLDVTPVTVLPFDASNLIENGHWQFAGSTVKPGNRSDKRILEIANVNQAIVKQDGSAGQSNPTINLYGTHLQTDGNFSITTQLSGVDKKVGFSVYGTPPLVEDEFRAEKGTLSMSIDGAFFHASISEESSGNNVEKIDQIISNEKNHEITVKDYKGLIDISIDNLQIAKAIPDHGIFKPGQIWLGFEAQTFGSKFQVDKISADGTTVQDSSRTSIKNEPNGFSALAQHRRKDFLFGAAAALGPMVADSSYMRLLGNYNAITTENLGKFQSLHPLLGNGPESYSFADMDAMVNIAKNSGIQVHGHALVFGEANPAWVQDIAKNHPEQLKQVMIDHITTVVNHYKGRVASWDVVNEPLADYDTETGQMGLRKNIWYNAIGPEYIALALQAAHAADPNASLWVNDFGMEHDADRFTQMTDLIKQLKSQGVPISGIGFQSHIDNTDTIYSDSHIDIPELKSRFSALDSLGLKARISELDITNDNEHAVYGDVVKACIESTNCIGITTWGISDKYSSSGQLNSNGTYTTGNGLPWNENFVAQQAVGDIKSALR